MSPVPPSHEIIRKYEAGELALELGQYHGDGQDDENKFVERCVALHNGGQIDLVALPGHDSFSKLNPHEFFLAQSFYCNAIPKLESGVTAVMDCCRLLIERGGNDLAANEPNRAFRTWCQNHPIQSATIVRDARDGNVLAKRFVTFALEAANDIDRAIEFIDTLADDRRLSAMTALSRMTFATSELVARAVRILERHVADGNADHERLNALIAAFTILSRYEDKAAAKRLAEAACVSPGSQLLYGLAQVAFENHAILEAETLRLIFAALLDVDPEQHGTLRSIDSALRQLLGTDREELALSFLSTKLQDSKIEIENFRSVAHQLSNGDQQRLYKLIVQWFLSGSTPLCECASALVGVDKERVFDATVQPPSLTSVQQIFVCRKAIGFLFIKPVVCCSIIVSILRAANPETASIIANLLYDPMLVNYGGETREYLKTIPSTDPSHAGIQSALAKAEAYYADLDGVGTIKELHPSEHQRGVQRQRHHNEMREVHKLAEGKSLLANLFQRSTILYGKRSRTYVTDEGGAQRAVDIELQSFEASFEFPRREILDPVGLNYLLRVFRVEKFK